MFDLKNNQGFYVPLIDSTISYLTSNCEDDVINTLSRYQNVEKMADDIGRTLLHVAASLGKNRVVRWLCEKGANLIASDYESHWTALHRATFYGHLDTATLLIQLGRSDIGHPIRKSRDCNTLDKLLSARDKNGLTYLDLIVADESQRSKKWVTKGHNVTFTWGLNANIILGHEKSQAIQIPDQVDCFRRLGVNMSLVSIGTYHTIFLSQTGEVYTCGHGIGGRLGHGDERSLLIPKKVTALSREKCKWVSASCDQSYFVTKSDLIYGCGVNAHNMLCQSSGVETLLVPKLLEVKGLKGTTIEKFFGLKNHVVVQTSAAIYTYGLNAGQLGHPKLEAEKRIAQPRCVTKVNSVSMVATSEAATVVVTYEGHVFLLHDYNCKKIFTSKTIKDICLSGGKLDETVTSDWSRSDHVKPRQLVVTVLCHSGKVYVWTDSTKTVRQVTFSPKWIRAQHIALSRGSNVLVVTSPEGQLWQGHVPYETKLSVCLTDTPPKNNQSSTQDRPIKFSEFVDVQLTRVANVHRAEQVAIDDKGTSFALIASNPNIRVYSDGNIITENTKNLNSKLTKIVIPKSKVWFGFHPASINSSFHEILRIDDNILLTVDNTPDVILQSKEGDRFTCHREILMSKAPYFESMFRQYNYGCVNDFAMGWCESTEGMTPTSMDMRTSVLSIFLTHVYSGSFETCNQNDLNDYSIISQCLMAADQYVVDDFKSSVEKHLCRLITLKNATYLATLSISFCSEVLEASALEFICDNAPCLLESGAFNDVDPEIMSKISLTYRHSFINSSYRTITPYDPLPFPSEVHPDVIQSAKKKRRPKLSIAKESIREDEAECMLTSKPTQLSPSRLATAEATVVDVVESSELSGSLSEVKSMGGQNKGPIKKVSQKSRKEEEKKKRLMEKESQKQTTGNTSSSSLSSSTPMIKANPWKIASNADNSNNNVTSPVTSPSPVTPSFKTLMELDMIGQHSTSPKTQTNTNNKTNSDRITTSFGFVMTNVKSRKQRGVHDIPSSPPAEISPSSPPTSVWGRKPQLTPTKFPLSPVGENAVAEPSDVFSSILKEEEKELETRHRLTNKSLHLVQLEERAMEELKAFYGADKGNEHIVITRASFTASKPFWVATQRHNKPGS